MSLGKRKALNAAPPPRKKQKSTSAIEEISFDTTAREEYLTGFHKRKLQRIKHAKEEAAKREREEKIAARKILREGRKADLEKHVQEVNQLIQEANGASEPSEPDSTEEGGGEQPWDGIADGAHEPSVMEDHEDEYMDGDRFTTVTVEAVDVSKDGLQSSARNEEGNEESVAAGQDRPDGEVGEGGAEKRKRVWSKEPPGGPKKRKKKFRYESKAERKVTRYKERSGNKAKARARKG